jgi:hypothetical protein
MSNAAVIFSKPITAEAASPKAALCGEKVHLMKEFLAAASDLIAIHNDQVKALIEDDPDFSRFDLLIHLANERKRQAKYNYVAHLEKHGC